MSKRPSLSAIKLGQIVILPRRLLRERKYFYHWLDLQFTEQKRIEVIRANIDWEDLVKLILLKTTYHKERM